MAIVGKPLPAWIDPLLWAVVPLPLLWASSRLLLGWGVDPGERLVHFLGLWSLHWLILTLAITPATWLLHWPHLVRLRRTLGPGLPDLRLAASAGLWLVSARLAVCDPG
jgi:sulfoxide reductase heme-binding subunit YedZ